MPCTALWVALLTSDECLIAFHRSATRAEWYRQIARSHRLSDAVRCKPCRVHGATKRARKLITGNAFLAGAKQKRCLKPLMQLQMRRLKNCSLRAAELAAAVVAFPETKTDA